MDKAQTVAAVIESLRGLFKTKDKLVGIDDWDTFIGCIIALENLAVELQKPEEKE